MSNKENVPPKDALLILWNSKQNEVKRRFKAELILYKENNRISLDEQLILVDIEEVLFDENRQKWDQGIKENQKYVRIDLLDAAVTCAVRQLETVFNYLMEHIDYMERHKVLDATTGDFIETLHQNQKRERKKIVGRMRSNVSAFLNQFKGVKSIRL